MPTTVTGLLLFVALLLPGLLYVTIRERNLPSPQRSVFRETATVAAVSAVAWLGGLAILAVARTVIPALTPDVGWLFRDATAYLGEEKGYRLLTAWLLGLLALALLGAGIAARVMNGRRPHSSRISSWWILFERWNPKKEKHVGCLLADGSYIAGLHSSHNVSAEETPDRDIVLYEPLQYRAPGDDETVDYPASYVCLSARQIVAMFVTDLDANRNPGSSVASSSPEAAVEGPQASEPPQASESSAPSYPQEVA